jgi:hypothetical protein
MDPGEKSGLVPSREWLVSALWRKGAIFRPTEPARYFAGFCQKWGRRSSKAPAGAMKMNTSTESPWRTVTRWSVSLLSLNRGIILQQGADGRVAAQVHAGLLQNMHLGIRLAHGLKEFLRRVHQPPTGLLRRVEADGRAVSLRRFPSAPVTIPPRGNSATLSSRMLQLPVVGIVEGKYLAVVTNQVRGGRRRGLLPGVDLGRALLGGWRRKCRQVPLNPLEFRTVLASPPGRTLTAQSRRPRP